MKQSSSFLTHKLILMNDFSEKKIILLNLEFNNISKYHLNIIKSKIWKYICSINKSRQYVYMMLIQKKTLCQFDDFASYRKIKRNVRKHLPVIRMCLFSVS